LNTPLFEDLANSIQQLILLGKGDVGRLEYILDLLKKGKLLPSSDQKYLESILPLYLSQKDTTYTQQSERVIAELHREIEDLNEKLSRLEKRGLEKYIGKKTILFFVTIFVGWNALQPYFISLFNLDVSKEGVQYLFPLNVLANYFGGSSFIEFIFILMILAWPFIGAVVLTTFIKTRKLSV
jgi:hypothetical protein